MEHAVGIDRDAHILDLACGDGVLIECAHRHGFTNIEGLDASEHELAAARERLGTAALLHRADVRRTGLPSSSFDAVLSHMALMLISPAESVLAEIARLCRPGARVLAVVNRPLRDVAFDDFRSHLQEAVRAAGLERLRLGDARMMRASTVKPLFAAVFEPDSVHVREFVVRLRGTPEQLWSKLRELYDVARLPDDAQQQLGRRALDSWRPLVAPDGTIASAMGMCLIDARARAQNN